MVVAMSEHFRKAAAARAYNLVNSERHRAQVRSAESSSGESYSDYLYQIIDRVLIEMDRSREEHNYPSDPHEKINVEDLRVDLFDQCKYNIHHLMADLISLGYSKQEATQIAPVIGAQATFFVEGPGLLSDGFRFLPPLPERQSPSEEYHRASRERRYLRIVVIMMLYLFDKEVDDFYQRKEDPSPALPEINWVREQIKSAAEVWQDEPNYFRDRLRELLHLVWDAGSSSLETENLSATYEDRLLIEIVRGNNLGGFSILTQWIRMMNKIEGIDKEVLFDEVQWILDHVADSLSFGYHSLRSWRQLQEFHSPHPDPDIVDEFQQVYRQPLGAIERAILKGHSQEVPRDVALDINQSVARAIELNGGLPPVLALLQIYGSLETKYKEIINPKTKEIEGKFTDRYIPDIPSNYFLYVLQHDLDLTAGMYLNLLSTSLFTIRVTDDNKDGPSDAANNAPNFFNSPPTVQALTLEYAGLTYLAQSENLLVRTAAEDVIGTVLSKRLTSEKLSLFAQGRDGYTTVLYGHLGALSDVLINEINASLTQTMPDPKERQFFAAFLRRHKNIVDAAKVSGLYPDAEWQLKK